MDGNYSINLINYNTTYYTPETVAAIPRAESWPLGLDAQVSIPCDDNSLLDDVPASSAVAGAPPPSTMDISTASLTGVISLWPFLAEETTPTSLKEVASLRDSDLKQLNNILMEYCKGYTFVLDSTKLRTFAANILSMPQTPRYLQSIVKRMVQAAERKQPTPSMEPPRSSILRIGPIDHSCQAQIDATPFDEETYGELANTFQGHWYHLEGTHLSPAKLKETAARILSNPSKVPASVFVAVRKRVRPSEEVPTKKSNTAGETPLFSNFSSRDAFKHKHPCDASIATALDTTFNDTNLRILHETLSDAYPLWEHLNPSGDPESSKELLAHIVSQTFCPPSIPKDLYIRAKYVFFEALTSHLLKDRFCPFATYTELEHTLGILSERLSLETIYELQSILLNHFQDAWHINLPFNPSLISYTIATIQDQKNSGKMNSTTLNLPSLIQKICALPTPKILPAVTPDKLHNKDIPFDKEYYESAKNRLSQEDQNRLEALFTTHWWWLETQIIPADWIFQMTAYVLSHTDKVPSTISDGVEAIMIEAISR